MFGVNVYVNFARGGETVYGVIEEIMDAGHPVLYRVLTMMHETVWLDACEMRLNERSNSVNQIHDFWLAGKTVQFGDWDDATGEEIVLTGVCLGGFVNEEDCRDVACIKVPGRFMQYTIDAYELRPTDLVPA